MDVLLNMFFDKDRWEDAINKGILKDIDKSELRKLTKPDVRKAMYIAIANDNYEIAPPHMAIHQNFLTNISSLSGDNLIQTCTA